MGMWGILTQFYLLIASYQGLAFSLLVSHDPCDIHFLLYPSQLGGHAQELLCGDERSLRESGYLAGAPLVIIIHGFFDSGQDPELLAIKNGYTPNFPGFNVIILDWSRLSTPPGIPSPLTIIPGYIEVVLEIIYIVANRTAGFILWLWNSQVLPDFFSVHIIGHSVGAHVGSEAGKRVQNMTDGHKLSRITGLDPAGPLFFGGNSLHPRNSLGSGDAQFVDTIHTNAGILGSAMSFSDASFIVNDGTFQPGCELGDVVLAPLLFPGACSHIFAKSVWISSFTKVYAGCPCRIWGNYLLKKDCDLNCSNPVPVGVYTSTGARGVFQVRRVPNPP